MQNESNEQRHARWEREKEADQAAIQLGLAYREARHGVCYWDKHASEAFRAGFEAGKKAQEQLAVAQQGEPTPEGVAKREDWIGIERPGTTELINIMHARGAFKIPVKDREPIMRCIAKDALAEVTRLKAKLAAQAKQRGV